MVSTTTPSMLAYPNWLNGSAFATPAIVAAGSWEADAPASNVLSHYLAKAAVSTDATTASTKIRFDFGAVRNVDFICVPDSNVSQDGQIKATIYTDAGFTTAAGTTGWVDYWADAYPWGARPWGSYGLFSPKLTPEDAEGYASIWWRVLASTAIGRYAELEIDDTANADGSVSLSRAFFGPAWRFVRNPDVGLDTGWKTTTRKRRGRQGAVFSRRGAFYRTIQFGCSDLEEDDAFTNAFDLGRRQGIDQEVVFVLDPGATVHSLRQTVYGQLAEPPRVRWTRPERLSTTLQIEELV